MNVWINKYDLWSKLGDEWKDELMYSLMKIRKWMKRWINVFTDES